MKRALALMCLIAVLLVACSAAPHNHPALGAVTGRLVIEGGAGGAPPVRPIQGVVQFIGGRHLPVTVSTNVAGAFWVQLPVGRYQVSDRSPHVLGPGGAWSAAAPVTVTAHHTTAITLTLFVP